MGCSIGSNTLTKGGYTIHIFTSSGIFTPQFTGYVEVLAVAGGGGGGMDMGGGGGGGGVLTSTTIQASTGVPIVVTVGAGGAGAPGGGSGGQPGGHQFTIAATNGSNTVISTLTAVGGGKGGSSYFGYTPDYGYGGNGGSGGGASGYSDGNTGRAGTGTAGQGNNGGGNSGQHYAGGGGGAGAAGGSGTGAGAAVGGAGILNSILGVDYYWGGGGGGASYSVAGGAGGIGGGGSSGTTTADGGAGFNRGQAGGGGATGIQANRPGGDGGRNTGGGGGGGSHYYINNKGGNGGSGIVIIKYKSVLSTNSTGGNIVNTNNLLLYLDAANDRSYSRNLFLSLGTVGSGAGADNAVTFPVQGVGTFYRLGYGQTFGGYTIQREDVVYKYTFGLTGGHYHGFDTTIPAGSYATFSFDYFVSTDATNYGINGNNTYLANFEVALSNSINVPNLQQGVWQRVSFTSGPLGSAGNLRALLYPGGGTALASSGYILFKNPTVELSATDNKVVTSRASATAITDLSTKNNAIALSNGAIRVGNYFNFDGVDDGITIPTINLGNGNVDWAVNCWLRTTSTATTLGTNPVLSNSSGGPVYSCLAINGGKVTYWTYQAGAWAQKGSIHTAINDGSWHMCTWVNFGASVTMAMYLDGVAVSTVLDSTSGNNNPVNVIGSSWAGKFLGAISQLSIFNRQLAPEEIKAMYIASRGRFGV